MESLREDQKKKSRKNIILLLCNVILGLGMILTAFFYSRYNQEQKNIMKVDAFCTTVESMKQVSENYLSTEKGYVDDWAAYISSQHMTAEEALEYIRTTNTHTDRAAHLVDMEDMSARSTTERNGTYWVHCYDEMLKQNTIYSNNFLDKMQEMFAGETDKVPVLGKYRVGELQRTVISVGTKVTIREEDGSDRDYLLLRLIPVEYLQKSWIFPTEFPTAEISMITRDGGYVIQSPSLRSSSFTSFIRGYNFENDYNKVDELAEQLETEDTGLMIYKDSAGRDSYFYYSSLGQDSDACILGYIPVADVQSDATDWGVILMICGTLGLLVIIDGSHILNINRKLRHAVDLAERANMAKTQFLSSMSHDIRTPMNAVIGMTEIAKHHLDDPAYVENCLNKVSISGKHLLTLINDILDISKVESGKMTLNPRAFSLQDNVEEMADMVRHDAEEKHLTLSVEIHDILQDTLIGDPLRLRQIMINLLNNAVKYTEAGGIVRFEVRQRPVEGTPEEVETSFVVADNGMGMTEEFQKTMYSSFSRATDSRINTIQGSGLGLSIAKQMVELMKGTIQCVSAPGQGTTFTVTLHLPAGQKLPEAEAALAEEGGANDEFSGMHVLVAEDNQLNWEIMQILLDEYGIRTDRAENGEICVKMLKDPDAVRYDMVLMDVQMPVMDGREATRMLRGSSDPYIRDIPVVAITADAFAEDIYACLEAGMDGHISKPVDMKQVVPYLRQAKNGTLHRKED